MCHEHLLALLGLFQYVIDSRLGYYLNKNIRIYSMALIMLNLIVIDFDWQQKN